MLSAYQKYHTRPHLLEDAVGRLGCSIAADLQFARPEPAYLSCSMLCSAGCVFHEQSPLQRRCPVRPGFRPGANKWVRFPDFRCMLLIFRRPLRGGFPFLWMSSGCGRFVCRFRNSLPASLCLGFPFADLKKTLSDSRPGHRSTLLNWRGLCLWTASESCPVCPDFSGQNWFWPDACNPAGMDRFCFRRARVGVGLRDGSLDLPEHGVLPHV